MQDQSRNKRHIQARRKYLEIDGYLAKKGSEKVDLLENKERILRQIDKHQKTINELDRQVVVMNTKLSELQKEIRPKSMEHSFCYRLMEKTKGRPRSAPNGIKVQQVDLYGNVISQFDSIQKAANETGVHRDIITKVLKGERTNCNLRFRRKKWSH
jgi:hypothetical protein